MAASTDPCVLLAQARQAKHDFLTGRGITEFRDQNGELIKYGAPGNLGALDAYIATLEDQCCPKPFGANFRRPLGFLFS